MNLFIGLGNPGGRYEKTRHNVGFMVIDALAREMEIAVNKKQGQYLAGQGFWHGGKVILVKPQTYMNKSGEAVLELLNYYQDNIHNFIVIHDDLDLEFGRIRFKTGGGTGGHNGLKSISGMLNSPDYDRLKIGIGRPPEKMTVESYVLSDFYPAERTILPEIIKNAVAGLKVWQAEGLDKAMNLHNGLKVGPEGL